MPKGYNADGSKKARPVGSGRKAKDGKKITPKLQQDVIDILAKQKSQACYIEKAVREKFAREQEAKRQYNQFVMQLELSKSIGQIDLLDLIEDMKKDRSFPQ